ncbi:histidinol-phosphate transaminase [Thiobacter aerophilum]|uniref:Histidinol-phosphate aminotransferase n=1 Tax=Thiobacter aerophilum TaxID=3121275 RepID=A0ABV0EGM6_9BURK
MNPDQLIRDEIRALTPYHVPEATGYVKLDAMENPYPLPEALRAEIAQLVAHTDINRYPDAEAVRLKARLRQTMGIGPEWDILLGNGSDELIQILAFAVARPGAIVLGLEPSFVMYRMIATFAGLRYVGVPLKPDFRLDREATLAAIRTHQPALVFIAYPNNPTGNLFDEATLLEILAAAPGLVVVDEAYHVFARKSVLPRLADYPNLLVMRTLSKLGLAGLRLGFLVGARAWLAELGKLRLPYNVNALTQVVAERVLGAMAVLEEQAACIREARGELFRALKALPGVEPYPSDANFILFRVPDAERTFEGLKRQGILIKNLNRAHPMLAGCLRVTVGTPEENGRFLHSLATCL